MSDDEQKQEHEQDKHCGGNELRMSEKKLASFGERKSCEGKKTNETCKARFWGRGTPAQGEIRGGGSFACRIIIRRTAHDNEREMEREMDFADVNEKMLGHSSSL